MNGFPSRPKPGNQAEGVRGSYYPDLHFIHEELEDLHASWNQKVPGYFGFGYAELGVGVCYLSIGVVVMFLEANFRTSMCRFLRVDIIMYCLWD